MSRLSTFSIILGVGTSLALVQPAAMAKSSAEVKDIAQAITVLIGSNAGGYASGIMLQRQGDVYTVLTAYQAVKQTGIQYTIKTADDRHYQIIAGSIQKISGAVDLAVVKFRSSNSYSLAKLGNSNLLRSGIEVYVAGFPAPTKVIAKSVFVLRPGQVTANSSRDFANGYSLIYSNDTPKGMSGGPVLNTEGEVVGIHGKGDISPGGKTGFNVGIPIARLAELAQKSGVRLDNPVDRGQQNGSLTADDLFVSGQQKSNAGDIQGALADFDRAIALQPDYAYAYNKRGNLKYENNPQAALADYDRAIALKPDYTHAYYNRGSLKQYKLNDSPGSVTDYQQVLSLQPNHADAYFRLGLLKHYQLDDPPGALADYDRAISLWERSEIALDVTNAAAYFNRGSLKHYKLDNPQSALADYDRAISIDPANAAAYYNRGSLKKNYLSDRPGAISDLQKAAKLYQQNRNKLWYQKSIDLLRELGA